MATKKGNNKQVSDEVVQPVSAEESQQEEPKAPEAPKKQYRVLKTIGGMIGEVYRMFAEGQVIHESELQPHHVERLLAVGAIAEHPEAEAEAKAE